MEKVLNPQRLSHRISADEKVLLTVNICLGTM